jgi:hypothetical protein
MFLYIVVVNLDIHLSCKNGGRGLRHYTQQNKMVSTPLHGVYAMYNVYETV